MSRRDEHKPVSILVPRADLNMTLVEVAAERHAAAPLLLGARPAAVDRHFPPARPTAANPPHAAVVAQDGQTDGQQMDRSLYFLFTNKVA